MNNQISFFIPGQSIPKGRPRYVQCGKFIRAYTHMKTQNFEYFVRTISEQHAPPEPWDGPLELILEFVFQKPKSAKKGDYWKFRKPDLDNLVKAIGDGMTGFWHGDQQVAKLSAQKHYGTPEGIEVTIKQLDHNQEVT